LTFSLCTLSCIFTLSLCSVSAPAVNVTQPYRVVSTNGTTQIQCFIHPPLPQDLQVTLLKGLHGSQKLCSSTLDPTEQREKSQNEGEVRINCEAQAVDGAVKVTVFGLRATDTDIYRCEIQVFYPPPYLQLTGNGTLIHFTFFCPSCNCPAREAQRQRSGEEEEDEPMIAPVSVPVIVLIILIVCVLVIIIYFQVSLHLDDSSQNKQCRQLGVGL
uniref:Uncharacterized protein n=1 Tax=Kryptolebias marmoratus TaxID=37003 RepID=A0A3Q2ZH68_KRYMA